MNSNDIILFFEQQLAGWEAPRDRYRELEQVLYRRIAFPSFEIGIQCNPSRILSSIAKTDAESLKQRACFLCLKNLPEEQGSLSYNEQLDIRINPFPIFPYHFTVPTKEHTEQRIAGRFGDMLSLAQDLPGFIVSYNGPSSGASAPDHFHFQLVPRHALPLEKEVLSPFNEKLRILSPEGLVIETIDPYIRKNLIIHGNDRELFLHVLDTLYNILEGITPPEEPEPMLNLLAWHDGKEWWVALFPRRKTRPWQFFAEGKEQLLFSPGCIDFAGVIVSPRQSDYDQYTPALLRDLFGQLTIDDNQWNYLKQHITREDSFCNFTTR